MSVLRSLVRYGRSSFQLSILSVSSIALIFLYASSEQSAIHHHALDDYHDNLHWAIDRTKAFNPFTFALGGSDATSVGGWHAQPNGKLLVPMDGEGNSIQASKKLRHPIYSLMEKGKKKWQTMLSRQSKTLHEAVREYKRRYGRMPPKGFDIWYKFATENNVVLIDEFDQINHDIAPYLAMSPDMLRARIAALEELPTSFHIEVMAGDLEIYGSLDEDPRSLDVAELIQDFAHLLPDLVIHASGHDVGSQVFGEDFRSVAAQLLSKGQYLTPENVTHFENKDRNPRKTLINACSVDSPAALEADGMITIGPTGNSVEFIEDHRATMNFCHNPAILDGHGGLIYNGARGSKISPYFVHCKLDQGGELLMPALAGFEDRSEQFITPWSERQANSIFWRGRTTGNHFNTETDWWRSHRIVLNNITTSHDGDVTVLIEDPETGELRQETYPRHALNSAYMDVGLVGGPTQCQNDGTCDAMAKGINFMPEVHGAAGQDNKYALDVDGNGWSQRFHKLLASGSMVLKMSIFPEWNTDWLIPYYHYVPIQHDYSDLYNTIVFFAGSPDGTGGHDDLAEQIAGHGVEFAKTYWRWEDMQAYMFRLLLEYARAGSLDRETMAFKMDAKTAL